MSRKKTHLDEFAAMAKLYEILKPFDQGAVARMWIAVEEKLKADRPKPRMRKAKLAPLVTAPRHDDALHSGVEWLNKQ